MDGRTTLLTILLAASALAPAIAQATSGGDVASVPPVVRVFEPLSDAPVRPGHHASYRVVVYDANGEDAIRAVRATLDQAPHGVPNVTSEADLTNVTSSKPSSFDRGWKVWDADPRDGRLDLVFRYHYPLGFSGTYRWRLEVVDDGGSDQASVEVLVVAGVLTIASPALEAEATIVRGTGEHAVQVQGTGFTAGTAVSVTGANVVVSAVHVFNATHLRFNLSAMDVATPGPRTLRLTNPDGEAATCRCIYVEALPQAVIAPDPQVPVVGERVAFVGQSRSDDSRVSITSWTWDLGDGNTSQVAKPVHTYERSGNHTVTLTVTDTRGHHATANRTVHVAQALPPFRVVIVPAITDTFPYLRQEINVSATFAALAQGGTPPYTYTWRIEDASLANTSEVTHTFPRLGSYPVNVTVNDASGNTTQASLLLHVFRPEAVPEPATVPPNGTRIVGAPEGSVSLVAKPESGPTAHIKVDIGKSPEAVNREPRLKLSTPDVVAARYMSVTVFDEHDILDFNRVRIAFNYTVADVQELQLGTLAIYYWNGSAWLDTRLFLNATMPGDTPDQDRFVFDAGHDQLVVGPIGDDPDLVLGTMWVELNEPSPFALAGAPVLRQAAGGGGGGGGGRAPATTTPADEPVQGAAGGPGDTTPATDAAPPLTGGLGFDRTSSLTLTRVPGGAHLDWTAPATVAGSTRGYQLWRNDGEAWVPIADVDASRTSWLDPNATEGSRYKVTFYIGDALGQGRVDDPALLDTLAGWSPLDYRVFSASPADGSGRFDEPVEATGATLEPTGDDVPARRGHAWIGASWAWLALLALAVVAGGVYHHYQGWPAVRPRRLRWWVAAWRRRRDKEDDEEEGEEREAIDVNAAPPLPDPSDSVDDIDRDRT